MLQWRKEPAKSQISRFFEHTAYIKQNCVFDWCLILKDKSPELLVKLKATYLLNISNNFEDYILSREMNKQKK